MAVFLGRCFGCSLLSLSILSGLTTMVLYVMSFSLELWWIIDAEVRLPIPAYLLALAYLSMSVLSLALLVGLRTKRTKLLLAWLLFILLIIFPEAGMLLFMAIYYWNGNTYGIIELGLWILRLTFGICGMICTKSLYTKWKDESSVLKSLEELNQANQNFIHHGEYKKPFDLGYNNAAFSSSYNHLISKYSTSSQNKPLKRSLSSVSQFAPASLGASASAPGLTSRSSFRDNVQPRILSAALLTGYKSNEFDTSKFTSGLAWRTQSQYDLPSFGLDPDEPIFITSYAVGGVSTKPKKQLSLASKNALPNIHHDIQWYRPRSLINLDDNDDDEASIWSDVGKAALSPKPFFNTQSLNRQQLLQASRLRAQSLGALNHGYLEEGGIVRGGVGLFCHHPNRFHQPQPFSGESKQSLGQYSDHVERYRDVAL